MKWIHWTARQPENNEWILAYTDERTMSPVKYRTSDTNWESERLRPYAKRKGWVYWVPLKEVPEVPLKQPYAWWKEEPKRTAILEREYGIKKDLYLNAKKNCPLCDTLIGKHTTTKVNGDDAFVCFGTGDAQEALMLWIPAKE